MLDDRYSSLELPSLTNSIVIFLQRLVVPLLAIVDVESDDGIPSGVPLGAQEEADPSAPEATPAMPPSEEGNTGGTPKVTEAGPSSHVQGPASTSPGSTKEETEADLTLGGSLSDLISPIPRSVL